LTTYFRITDILAWNPKSPVLRGEKPALLFPFGWQTSLFMGWSIGKRKKAWFGGSGFWERVSETGELHVNTHNPRKKHFTEE